MAYVITLKILVATENEEVAEKSVTDIMELSEVVGKRLDYSIESIDKSIVELDNLIFNDAYELGNAFQKWLIFSKSEKDLTGEMNSGYWSNEYGWGSKDLATRFDGSGMRNMPISSGDDAISVMEH